MSRLRTRLPRLLTVWGIAAAVETVLYYLLLSQPYFRGFFLPVALAVLVAGALDTWRVLRVTRHTERRLRERRVHERSVEE